MQHGWIDAAQPINNQFARGLVSMWLTAPNAAGYGSLTWRDFAKRSNGALTNSPVWGGAIGRQGGYGSLRCIGSDDGVNLGTNEPLASLQAPMTLCGWFRPDGVAGTQNLFAQYTSTVGHQLVKLLRLDGATLAYYSSKADGTFQGGFNHGTSVTAAIWSFAAVVVGGTTASPSGCNLYLAPNGTGLTATSFSPAALSSTPDTSVPCGLGIRPAFPNSEHFTGAFDGWRAYSRDLSGGEILAVMQDDLRGNPQTLNWIRPSRAVVAVGAAARMGARNIGAGFDMPGGARNIHVGQGVSLV